MPYPDPRQTDLTVGIPQVDREHAELLAEIGRLVGPPAVRIDSEAFTDIASRLGRRLADHFESEERIIERCGLSSDEIAAHRLAHRDILEQYAELQFDLMFGLSRTPAEIMAMIHGWIVEHQIVHDLKLRLAA